MDSELPGKSEKGVLAAVTFSHFSQHFYVGLSILYPYMMSDLSLSYTQLGVFAGVNNMTSGFLQIVWSVLDRRVSRRVLLGLGNVLVSIGSFFTGIASWFGDLVGASALSGGGLAAQHPVGTSIITNKFSPRKMSGALAIHYGFGYVGNIVSPLLLSFVAILVGWRPATYVLAAVPLLTGLTVLLYLRGEKSAMRVIPERGTSNLSRDLKSALHVKSAVLIIAVQAFASSGTGQDVITTYLPLFLKNQLNVEILETSVVYSIAVAAGVFGTIFFGHLGNRLGTLRTAVGLLGAGSIAIFLLVFDNSYGLLLILHLIIVGITSFSFPTLLQSYLASISSAEQRGILLGLFFTVGFGVSAMWAAITGFLIDIFGSFNAAWTLRAILGTISFLIAVEAFRHRPT
jgi:FSR family fosmidomycin resistance protein-like MFS transporter